MSIKVKAIECNVSFDKKEGRPPFVEPPFRMQPLKRPM